MHVLLFPFAHCAVVQPPSPNLASYRYLCYTQRITTSPSRTAEMRNVVSSKFIATKVRNE